MNKILISGFSETFRQFQIQYTPIRNVRELRTFNPKLKDSAGGEVNDSNILKQRFISPSNPLTGQPMWF